MMIMITKFPMNSTNTISEVPGSCIYPISTRTPFQIAMVSATLDELSNGRVGFIGLGIGYGNRI